MAYIIAHGTVNGYSKITQTPPIGTEQGVLTDIRYEFDNTQTMLDKPCGYLIQMAENGVWISIVKLLFDGERPGNGAGFFAFSAFVPNNQVVAGAILKQHLDNLMQNYQTQIDGDFSKNKGIDWSCVEQAAAQLNASCQPRSRIANTNYRPHTQQFAYVNCSKDEIVQYLDKPFQPEYGEYHAVFIGNYLQNPNRLASQTPLTIDFENEPYTIKWNGNSASFPNLPKEIRKKDIQNGSYLFEKKYYVSQTINFRDGTIDDVNCEITLEIPKLIGENYSVPITCRPYPDAISSVEAQSNTIDYPYPSDQNGKELLFCGEEAGKQWRIIVIPKEGYICDNKDNKFGPITPYEMAGKEYIISGIKKAVSVEIKIFLDGKEDTRDYVTHIEFSNKHGKTLTTSVDKKTNSCTLPIPEDTNFEDYVTIKFKSQNNWEIDKITSVNTSASIYLKRKKDEQTKNPFIKKYKTVFIITGVILCCVILYFAVCLGCRWTNTACPGCTWLAKNSTSDSTQVGSISDTVQRDTNLQTISIQKFAEQQATDWNFDAIDKYLDEGKWHNQVDSMKINPTDKEAYDQLIWLQNTRKIINEATTFKDYNQLTGKLNNDEKKKCVNDTLWDLLNQINKQNQGDQAKKFCKVVQQDTIFKKKKVNEVLNLWKTCETKQTSTSKKSTGTSNNNKDMPTNSKTKVQGENAEGY